MSSIVVRVKNVGNDYMLAALGQTVPAMTICALTDYHDMPEILSALNESEVRAKIAAGELQLGDREQLFMVPADGLEFLDGLANDATPAREVVAVRLTGHNFCDKLSWAGGSSLCKFSAPGGLRIGSVRGVVSSDVDLSSGTLRVDVRRDSDGEIVNPGWSFHSEIDYVKNAVDVRSVRSGRFDIFEFDFTSGAVDGEDGRLEIQAGYSLCVSVDGDAEIIGSDAWIVVSAVLG